jgi:hypothetical protein
VTISGRRLTRSLLNQYMLACGAEPASSPGLWHPAAKSFGLSQPLGPVKPTLTCCKR